MKKAITIALVAFFATNVLGQFTTTNGPSLHQTVGFVWGSNDTGFVTYNKNLYRTFDGGASWTIMREGLPLDVDPRAITAANGKIFIGTNANGPIYSSTDWGNSWTIDADGSTVLWKPTHMTSNGKVALIGGTLFEPHYYDETTKKWISSGLSGTTHALKYVDENTVIANVGNSSTGFGHVSTDGGKTWTQFNDEPAASVLKLKAKTFDYLKIGSRIVCTPSMNGYNPQYSDDQGDTWTEGTGAAMSALPYYGSKLAKLSDGTLLLNKTGAMYKSLDSGKTWQNATAYIGGDFTIWQTDDILCSGGIIDDNGSARIRLTATTINLVALNQKLHTQAGDFSCLYDGNQWQLDSMTNTTTSIFFGETNRVVVVDDSVYICAANGLFGSKNGKDFTSVIQSEIVYAQVGSYGKFGSNYVIGTVSTRGNVQPKIYYSTDNRKTWQVAKFSNNIGFGAGGVANRIDNFFELNGKLYADLHGGYAVSSDNGANWTWAGGSTFGNVVTDGTNLIRLFDDVIRIKPRNLEVSTDGGDNWTSVLDGLPGYTGQTNFSSFGDVFSVGGKIYVDAYGDANRRLMVLDVANKKWVETSKNMSIPAKGGLIDLYQIGEVYYATFANDGVYKSDGSAGFNRLPTSTLSVYPNPSHGTLTITNASGNSVYTSVSLYQMNGAKLGNFPVDANNTIDVSNVTPGMYILEVPTDGEQLRVKILID